MKTLKIFLVVVIILMVAKAYALKPMSVPKDIQAEAAAAELIFRGTCPHEGKNELCLVGYDRSADVFWVLLFNEEGVLYRVLDIKEGKERVRWSHPHISI